MGRLLRGGEVIELLSDLGGGKTTFVRGLARGVGSKDHVSSPTFKICNSYKTDDGLTINHFDFYRLRDAGLIEFEMQDYLDDPKSIIVIEWGGVVSSVIPDKKVEINIVKTGEGRIIKCEIPHEFEYLAKGLNS